jgi:hypothetical protein
MGLKRDKIQENLTQKIKVAFDAPIIKIATQILIQG